ncbi:sulfotransferase family protein [Roseobacteraceae bacterium S113]
MKFCIVGSGRCGSTFLRKLFSMHPDVFLRRELPVFPKMYTRAGHMAVPVQDLIDIVMGCCHIEGVPSVDWSRDEVEALFGTDEVLNIRAFLDRLYLGFAAQLGTKRAWADKCPDYGFYMHAIQQIWPECKFVHMLRDGRDVALSMQRHDGFRWLVSAREPSFSAVSYNQYFRAVPAGDPELIEFLRFWSNSVRRIEDEATRLHEGSYQVFRFERLMSEPEETLREMTRFLGLPCPDDWIARSIKWPDPSRIGQYSAQTHGFAEGEEAQSLLRVLGY